MVNFSSFAVLYSNSNVSGWEIYGDFVVESEKSRAWRAERTQLHIRPQSLPSNTAILPRQIDCCHPEFSCNSRKSPGPTWGWQCQVWRQCLGDLMHPTCMNQVGLAATVQQHLPYKSPCGVTGPEYPGFNHHLTAETYWVISRTFSLTYLYRVVV